MRLVYKLKYINCDYIINNISCTVEMHRKCACYIDCVVNTRNEYIAIFLPYFVFHNNSILDENYKYFMYRSKLCVQIHELDVNMISIKIQPKIVQDEDKQANIGCAEIVI